MAVVEIVLGALCVLAGGGVGWIGRGRFEARRALTAAWSKPQVTQKEKSERRKAGGAKAAATRKANAEKKALEAQAKVDNPEQRFEPQSGSESGLGLVQKQQFNGLSGNGATDPAMYGRRGDEL